MNSKYLLSSLVKSLISLALLFFFMTSMIDKATGQCSNLIYVTTTGSGIGSKADPSSLTNAVNIAQSGDIIKIATGTYNINNALNIPSGVTFEGGFNAGSDWDKTSLPGATTINRTDANPEGAPAAPRLVAFYGNGVSNFRFQDITIQTADATPTTGAGMSTYAVHLNSCSNYHFVRTQLAPGNAGDGANGANGVNGANGSDGLNGGNGHSDCDDCDGFGGNGGHGAGIGFGAGGNGAPSNPACCNTGTDGFTGNTSTNSRAGGGGGGGARGGQEDRNGGLGGNGGAIFGNTLLTTSGGGRGFENGCNFGFNFPCEPDISGKDGGAGNTGSPGALGALGGAGSYLGGFFIPNQGGTGSDGTGGKGGKGGGGGAGKGGTFCLDGAGAGGGGGGGGGQGGTGGLGGFGGGNSYGLFLVNNGAQASIVQSNITTATGGAGGVGGDGGTGGNGGNGGTGGTDAISDFEIGCGGDGGDGGAGGNGGTGGNGAAGLAFSVYYQGGITLEVNESNFALTSQPVITASDIDCTMKDVDFTSLAAQNWDFGSGANPGSATGANVVTQYNTTGRKDIVYNGATYSGFKNITNIGAIQNASFTTTAPLVMGNFVIMAGSSVDFSAGDSGQFYEWDLDGGANPDTYSGTGFQDLTNITFNDCGIYTISLYYSSACCGPSTTATISLQVISTTYPDYTFTGANMNNPNDPSNADNWDSGCIPPVNDPNVNITILEGATFIGTDPIMGDIFNYGTLKGTFILTGNLTNYGVFNPGI